MNLIGPSLRPRHVWKRRKAAAKRKANPDCPVCKGRGIELGQRHECPCTEQKR